MITLVNSKFTSVSIADYLTLHGPCAKRLQQAEMRDAGFRPIQSGEVKLRDAARLRIRNNSEFVEGYIFSLKFKGSLFSVTHFEGKILVRKESSIN